MRRKFFVILVCCLLALAVLVLSQNGEQVIKANQIKSLQITPKIAPKPAPRLILKFSTREELQQLLLQQEEEQEQAYPETYMGVSGVAAANADIRTGRVWAVALNDGLDPLNDVAHAGFKTNGLQNNGPTPVRGVTVTVTANILEMLSLSPSNAVGLCVIIYGDGEFIEERCQRIGELGNYSVTSSSFTMEPGYNYHARGYIRCQSYVENQAAILIAEITDIDWNI